ncbi:MAG: heavy-metal-associated domain-containing protein [Quisquiliibacterium sp.]|jgi:copper chaperone
MLNLTVKGMSCQHCVKAVTNAIQELDANAKVEIDLPSGQVAVQSSAPDAKLREAIAEAGYEIVA